MAAKPQKTIVEKLLDQKKIVHNSYEYGDGSGEFMDGKEVADAIAEVEQKLGQNGRVLVRASGTEPLVRVMLEGKDIGEITELAEYIADKIRNL